MFAWPDASRVIEFYELQGDGSRHDIPRIKAKNDYVFHGVPPRHPWVMLDEADAEAEETELAAALQSTNGVVA